MLAIDDLRPNLGSYSSTNPFLSPTMVTPQLDQLASRSLVLEKAYSQLAWCSPSRTSLLTSRRPDTTRVNDLRSYFRKFGGNFTTIPQFFKNKGYRSVGMGKVFHYNKEASNKGDPPSWSEPFIKPHDTYYSLKKSWRAVPEADAKTKPLVDTLIANEAIGALRRLAPKALNGDEPFFLGAGFFKPHLPFIFPERFLSLYPASSIQLPDNQFAPVDMPAIAWSKWEELPTFEDVKLLINTTEPPLGEINATMPTRKTLELRRAYYASISYIDYEIGRILSELSYLGLASNTIVAVWGDHGFQLGEHSEWCKHTNFEVAARTPLLLHIPGLTDEGVRTSKLVELLDLFPTLVSAAGFPPLPSCPRDSSNVDLCTEGDSLLPLLGDPEFSEWKENVFWQYPRKGWYPDSHVPRCMGYTVRNKYYR